MRWDLFFEDLEDQLASEWEAERAALDTEAERLRISRMELRSRLAALLGTDGGDSGPMPSFDLADGTSLSAEVRALGADWVGTSGGARGGMTIVPFASIRAIGLPHADVLRSARPSERPTGLADRMTLGFVMRDVARRRLPVSMALASGRVLSGTIDRAGADHLDLALHEPGSPRRGGDVTGYRLVPFAGIAWVRVDDGGALRLP